MRSIRPPRDFEEATRAVNLESFLSAAVDPAAEASTGRRESAERRTLKRRMADD